MTCGHWLYQWLLTSDMAMAEVARVTRYAVNWVHDIARRHREEGPAAIGDCRHGIPGGAPLTPAVR